MTDQARAVTGNAGKRGRVLAHPSAVEPAAPVVDEFDAPNDLTTDERNVWLELAPFAFANRTLTRSTSLAFRMLCRNVVLERQYAQSMTDKGGANHRGLIQRVDAELLAFNLRPCGKAIDEPSAGSKGQTPPANPLAKYLKGSRGA